jgi:hypothetical protein
MTKQNILKTALIFFVFATMGFASDYYVAKDGSDQNPGTLDKPFATLDQARDAIRASKAPGATVWIRQGVYILENTFALTKTDSGTGNAPIVYRAYQDEKVSLVGGRILTASDFKAVKASEVLSRINPSVRDKIVEADLKTLGIKHANPYPDIFTDNGGIMELFFDNKRMPLSAYPDEYGTMTIKRVLVNGGGQEKPGNWRVYYNTGTPQEKKALELGSPRPGVFEYRSEHQDAHARWAKVLDRGVWMKGYWRIPWQNEVVRAAKIDTVNHTVQLAVPVEGGIGNKYERPAGSGKEVYWVMNLLEEIDRPGEWAIDFKDKKLYFYPPSSLEKANILISDMASPVIKLDQTSYVTIQGMTLEGSLQDGVRITDGQNISILGCIVRNVAKYAVFVDGGFNHTVRSCDLYALGAGGVWLSGGDADSQPRIAANHKVVNNDIHHFGEIERVYAPGVNVGFIGGGGGSAKVNAVGMYVANNAIHHCPHAGVLFNSYDNVFEYNEVFQHCMVSNDMGAFYSYSKDGAIGYETFRYNFMHSSPEGEGIYYDNVTNHPKIYGNIAYKLGPKQGTGRGFGFLVKNPTRQRVDIYNNIAAHCKVGYDIVLGGDYLLENNISVENLKDTNNLPEAIPGICIYRADPGFADLNKLNLDLKAGSAVFKDIPGFQKIPFEKIGLFRDEYRKNVPDYRTEISQWNPREETASGYKILDRQ